MKLFITLLAAVAVLQIALAERYNVVCYYDTASIERGGYANFTELDLKTSLEYCTHIVFGYVGLNPTTFEIQTLHPRQQLQFSQIRTLKTQYRNVKFLLSLGGDKDLKNNEKYMKLLATNDQRYQSLINSAKNMLLKYKFDGFDLAYQFPHNKFKNQSKVKKVLDKAKNFIKNNGMVKKAFGGSKKVGVKVQSVIQKQQFTLLVREFRRAFSRDRLMLTLTVLPNINATAYIDIPAIMSEVDFINLGTYDYSNPQISPHQADYLAPLQLSNRSTKGKQQQVSIETEVRQWLSYRVQGNKLNLGVATFGRTWKMNKALKSNIMPITSSLNGPAGGGELTHTPGLLSWTEVCGRLEKMSVQKDKTNGNYAYRSANVKGHEGILVTFENKESLEEKADYVRKNALGGVAIFDLSLDDFRGKCRGGKFPALKAIKFKLH